MENFKDWDNPAYYNIETLKKLHAKHSPTLVGAGK
jgi:hypothetical protein